jgi:hypothetical protein
MLNDTFTATFTLGGGFLIGIERAKVCNCINEKEGRATQGECLAVIASYDRRTIFSL